ncbi:hypothetical protein MHYP_G00175060 [Metynnis hypsauchen]
MWSHPPLGNNSSLCRLIKHDDNDSEGTPTVNYYGCERRQCLTCVLPWYSTELRELKASGNKLDKAT